jgi:hypothetical protein
MGEVMRMMTRSVEAGSGGGSGLGGASTPGAAAMERLSEVMMER